MSDDTAKLIDDEIRKIIDRNYARANRSLKVTWILSHERCVDEV